MKEKIFPLMKDSELRNSSKKNLYSFIDSLPEEVEYEVSVKALRHDKTKRQLGAIFGLWVNQIAEHTGESQHEVRRSLKMNFLTEIYLKNPVGNEQNLWASNLAAQISLNLPGRVVEARDLISLSWASKEQLVLYINNIHNYATSMGIALSDTHKARGLSIGQ